MKGKYRQFWDGVGPGDLFPASPTQILSNLYHYLLHFTLFFPLPVLASLFFSSLSPSTPTTSFFSSSSLLTLCIGSGVLAVMWLFVRTQLPVFAIGRCFFERALVSRVTGNGGTTSLFSAAASPPPLPSALLWAGLSLSLPQAVVDQVAHEHDTHRQWRWLCSSSSSPSSPFSSGSRQSQRPLGCRRWVKQMALFVEI